MSREYLGGVSRASACSRSALRGDSSPFFMEREGAEVAIGAVDVATFGSVLLHVLDPFLALQNALRLTRETVVVTETTSALPDPRQKPRGIPFNLNRVSLG